MPPTGHRACPLTAMTAVDTSVHRRQVGIPRRAESFGVFISQNDLPASQPTEAQHQMADPSELFLVDLFGPNVKFQVVRLKEVAVHTEVADSECQEA